MERYKRNQLPTKWQSKILACSLPWRIRLCGRRCSLTHQLIIPRWGCSPEPMCRASQPFILSHLLLFLLGLQSSLPQHQRVWYCKNLRLWLTSRCLTAFVWCTVDASGMCLLERPEGSVKLCFPCWGKASIQVGDQGAVISAWQKNKEETKNRGEVISKL